MFIEDRRKPKGWWWEDDEIFDVPISRAALIVRLYLTAVSNKIDGRRVTEISIGKIAKNLRMGRMTVYRAVNELVSYHLLEVTSGAVDGIDNKYLILPAQQWRKPLVDNSVKGIPIQI